MKLENITNTYYEIFSPIKNSWKDSNYGEKENSILDGLLDFLGFEKNKKTRYIAFERIALLNEQPLKLYINETKSKVENVMKSNLKVEIPNKVFDEEKILQKAYDYVVNLYETYQYKLINELKNELDDFTFTLFKGVYNVGKAFNVFYKSWKKHIDMQNKILENKFSSPGEIIEYLEKKNLLQKDENGNLTPRSYSVIKNGKILSYAEAFVSEVRLIVIELNEFIDELRKFSNSTDYINYLNAIKEAFEEKDPTKTYKKWQKVDEYWMKLNDDIQISHPLEFYEDKYRKAVAPEWDLRVKINLFDVKSKEGILNLFKLFKEKYSSYSHSVVEKNLNNVKLFISEPVLYFGPGLDGLFSAQVVPNDEEITEKFGKKIFAFPKETYFKLTSRPISKLFKTVFNENIIDLYKQILADEKLFYKIYDFETIGHEFGHILWVDQNTEILMNKTGQLKNIEEFKATTGGLIVYFLNEDSKINTFMMVLHLTRVINLLKYQEVSDIIPYYCEALFHLEIMFKSGFLKLENKVSLDFSNYEKLKKTYMEFYDELVKIYLDKKDAGEFLFKYLVFDKVFLPKKPKLRQFVKDFYALYLKIGNEI